MRLVVGHSSPNSGRRARSRGESCPFPAPPRPCFGGWRCWLSQSSRTRWANTRCRKAPFDSARCHKPGWRRPVEEPPPHRARWPRGS
jgi:hypothetical protein